MTSLVLIPRHRTFPVILLTQKHNNQKHILIIAVEVEMEQIKYKSTLKTKDCERVSCQWRCAAAANSQYYWPQSICVYCNRGTLDYLYINAVQRFRGFQQLTCPPQWYPWEFGSSRHSTPPGRPRPWTPGGWLLTQYASSWQGICRSQRRSGASPNTPFGQRNSTCKIYTRVSCLATLWTGNFQIYSNTFDFDILYEYIIP